jgi:chromosome segregation ATPase
MAEESDAEEREESRPGWKVKRVAAKVRALQEPRERLEQLEPSEAEHEMLERMAQYLEAKAEAGASCDDVAERVVEALAAARDAAVAKVAARMSEAESALHELQQQGHGDLEDTHQKVQQLEHTLRSLQQQHQQHPQEPPSQTAQGNDPSPPLSADALATKVEEQAQLLDEAVSRKRQLESELASEQEARSAAEQRASDAEAELSAPSANKRSGAEGEPGELQALRAQLEDERKQKDEALSKLEEFGGAFESLEKERNEATNILEEADRTRNELERERESVSKLKQELLEAQQRQQQDRATDQASTKGETTSTQHSVSENVDRHLQEQSKALSLILKILSSSHDLSSTVLQQLIEPLEIAIKEKDAMAQDVQALGQRALQADYAAALDSRLKEAKEDMASIVQGLSSAIGAEDEELDARQLLERVRSTRTQNERLSQMLEKCDEHGDQGAAQQDRPEASEEQATHHGHREREEAAHSGYVASLKERIHELETELDRERPPKGSSSGEAAGNVESQLNELRRCYEQLKHSFSQHCVNQRRLQNFILQQRLNTPAILNAADEAATDGDNDGVDVAHAVSGTPEVESRITCDLASADEHLSSEGVCRNETAERRAQRPPPRGKRLHNEYRKRKQQRRGDECRRKRVSSPSSARGSVGTIDEVSEWRGDRGDAVHLVVPHSEETEIPTRSPSVGRRKSAQAAPVHRRADRGQKSHIRGTLQPSAGGGTPRFCKRPKCDERVSCDAHEEEIPVQQKDKQKKSGKRQQAKIYAFRPRSSLA